MATLVIPNSFTAGTPAVASSVNANFAAVRDFVELVAEGVNIDLGVIEVNRLSAGAVTTLSPMGSVLPYAGVVEPASWKFCNGQALTIADHTALYNLLTSNGTVFRYGANPTVTTFLLPNLSHRVPVGLGTETEFNVLGETGGAKNSIQAHTHPLSATVTETNINHNHGVNQSDAGGHAHSWSTTSGAHQHQMDVDQLDATVAHGHGTDGTLMSGTSATPSGSTSAFTSSTGSFVGDHSHSGNTTAVGDPGHSVSVQTGGGSHAHGFSCTATSTGSESGNLQPYITLNYIIRVS